MMDIKQFRKFFSQSSGNFTLGMIAEEGKQTKNSLEISSCTPIFDAIDLFEKYDCLATERGVVKRTDILERPTRVLFFMLIVEIEYSLYKILKQFAKSKNEIEHLRALFLNDLIKEFLANSDLLKIQNVYNKRSETKDDLKAVSSFRNVIVHSNAKMLLETEYDAVIKRKKQILRLLDALEQIIDGLKIKAVRWV